MRASIYLAMLCLSCLATVAFAQKAPPKRPAAVPPRVIETSEDWKAVTNMEAGQRVCYAFTRAKSSSPALHGRGNVVLTVTQRSTIRDAVALSAGFEYAANAAVTVLADQTRLDFYTSTFGTSKSSAFARDGHAAVAAFRTARQAVARSPGPHGAEISDSFSLRGFDRAFAAINKECPAK